MSWPTPLFQLILISESVITAKCKQFVTQTLQPKEESSFGVAPTSVSLDVLFQKKIRFDMCMRMCVLAL